MYIDIILADENMVSFDSFVDIDYKINSSDNNELLLGNASAASLNFSIWNGLKRWNEFKFKGSTAHLYRDEERTERIGIFTVDKITKDKNALNFECTDYMTKFDVPFKGIQTPFTLWELLNQLGIQLGIKIANKEEDFEFFNQFKYNTTDDILNISCREVLKLIGEVCCKYFIFNSNGELYGAWYDMNTIKKQINYNQLKSFARDEQELNITKVKVIMENEEFVQGLEEGYDLRLTNDNPFLKPLNVASINLILQNIYNQVYGMKYLSCDIEITTDKDLEIGDTLRIEDEDGNFYKMLITYLNINKLFLTKITSAGENVNRDSKTSSKSSSSSNTSEKTYIAKDENWKNLSINNFKGETFLNSISIFGVNEKSSAFLSFSLEFESTIEDTIKFLLYTNDTLTKEISFYVRTGTNVFNWAESANVKVDAATNVFKFVLDTSEVNQDFYFNAKIGSSVLSVISSGARAGSNIITNLEFKEEFNKLTLVNNINRLILKPFEETLEVIVQEYIDKQVEDIFEEINFKSRNNIIIDDITESIEEV